METYTGGRTTIANEKSGVRIFLLGGIIFLTVVPLLLMVGVFFTSEKGEFLKGLFPMAFAALAVVSAATGLVAILVAGFILLVRAVPDPTHGSDILGTAAPQEFRHTASIAGLDLRSFWLPCLFLLVVFTVVRFLAHGRLISEDVFTPTLAFITQSADAVLFVLFFFFWSAGIARQNRAGLALPVSAFTWPAVALCAFFLPFIFL